MTDNKVQIIIEAYDKTKAAFGDLEKSLKGFERQATDTAKKGAEGLSVFGKTAQGIGDIMRNLGGALVAYFGARQLVEFNKMGAAALQAEESFRIMAAAAGESADDIVRAMKKASAGTIDDSDLMRKAAKAMALEISGADLVKLTEAARVAARITGESVTTTFEKIVDSVSTNMPRALKAMGLITKEQMALFNKAISEGVESVQLLDIVLANAAKQQEKFGDMTVTASEKVQANAARIQDLKEKVGMMIVEAVDYWAGIINKVANDPKTRAVAEFLGWKAPGTGEGAIFRGKIQPNSFDYGTGEGYIEPKPPAAAPKVRTPEEIEAELKAAIQLKKVNEEAAKAALALAKERANALEKAVEAQNKEAVEYGYSVATQKEALEMEYRSQQKINDVLEERAKLEAAAREKMAKTEGYGYEVASEEETRKMEERTLANTRDYADDMKTAVTGWAKDFSGTLNDVLWGSDLTFGSIAKSFAKMITQMTIQMKIIEPLMKKMFDVGSGGGGEGMDWGGLIKKGIGLFGGAASGGAGGFSGAEMGTMSWLSRGGVFNQGLVPFASGGLVVRPTVFPFAGGVGLMGEKGAEAIMPLSRTSSGDLGVKALGGGGITVNVHNNVGAEVTTSSPDGKTLDILIERKMLDTVRKNPSVVAEAWNSEATGGNRAIINTLRRMG